MMSNSNGNYSNSTDNSQLKQFWLSCVHGGIVSIIRNNLGSHDKQNKNQIIHFCLNPDFYPVEGASYKYFSFHVCALDYFCKMFAIIKLNNKFKSSFLYWLLESCIGLLRADILSHCEDIL